MIESAKSANQFFNEDSEGNFSAMMSWPMASVLLVFKFAEAYAESQKVSATISTGG